MLPTEFPAAHTRFIGRTRELIELRALLRTDRLLTLTGPGGSGKTRLALQLALDSHSAFEHGVDWCDLTTLTDPYLLPQTIVQRLGLKTSGRRAALDELIDVLRERQQLIVLDNCEQVQKACAALADALFKACPRLVILTTSLQPLGLPSEKVWPVPPLDIPQSDDVATLSKSAAVALFIDRAREVLLTFELTTSNAASIGSICRRLDGLPLAIELAAARVKMLSVAQIADRLDDAFRFLTRGTTAQLPRHQTLRAVMEWSYQCLSNAEQILLRRLAVFAGSFTLDTVEAICDLQDLNTSTLDVLSDLADKSWLVVVRQSDRETARYRLLETIRQYAHEQLIACGELAVLHQRLLEWGSALAEQAKPRLTGPDQTLWLERLESELDNLRVALRWAAAPEATPEAITSGLRMASALERLWWAHGHLSEGRAWLSALLAGNTQSADPVRANALFAAGVLAYRQSDYAAASAYLTEALELRRRLNDGRGMAFVLNNLGSVALERGDNAHAESLYSQALDLRRGLNDQWGIASSLNNLGTAVFAQGDYVRAAHLYDESLSLYRQLGDSWSIASTLNNLGETQRRLGESTRARALFELSLELRRNQSDQRGVALVLFNWASLTLAERNWAKTAALLAESMTLLQAGHNLSDWVRCLERYALLQARQRRSKNAARLYGAAEALRHMIGAPVPTADRAEYDQGLAEVHAQIDEESFAAAWAVGQTLTVDQAMAEVQDDIFSEPRLDTGVSSTDPPVPPILRIYALGPAQVVVGERALSSADWTYTKAKELLFYFIANPPATKAQIGLDVWPDASANQLRNIFHRALHHLRKALGQPDWIVFAGDAYSFNRTLSYWCDLHEFEALLGSIGSIAGLKPTDRASVIQRLDAAVQLWRGDFVEDLDAGEWAIFKREELRRRYVQALIDLGALYFVEAQYDRAIAVYRRLLALDNYLELAHRELMRCFARQGETGHAIQHFQQFRALLRTELQTEPSPETVMLYERLKRGESV